MKIKARTSTHHLKGLVQIGYTYYTIGALSLILGRPVGIRNSIIGLLEVWRPPNRTKKKPHSSWNEVSIKGSNDKTFHKSHVICVSTAKELLEGVS